MMFASSITTPATSVFCVIAHGNERGEKSMSSTSPAQAKLMDIAAHTPGGYGGVPQKVGAEFHAADKQQQKYKYAGPPDKAKKMGAMLRKR
jgi:hypothetical protein